LRRWRWSSGHWSTGALSTRVFARLESASSPIWAEPAGKRRRAIPGGRPLIGWPRTPNCNWWTSANRLNLEESRRIKPFVASVQLITNVDPYQAQLLNRFRRGSMLVAGETLLVLEVAPAAYINIAANEAEKRANIKLIHISSVGRFGRMWMCGSESEMVTAKMAAIAAIENIEGRQG